jgi:hypothetical protein
MRPALLAVQVCDSAGTIRSLSDEPRPALGWFSRWIAVLTTPFKFLGISGWKETGCEARVLGSAFRAAQHSTDGFWTIDMELDEFKIGDACAPDGRFVRIEVEPGTPAHATCANDAVIAGTQLELGGPIVIDTDSGGFLEIHPDADFRILRADRVKESFA